MPDLALPPHVADHLLAHLTGARWFGGKGRHVRVVGRTPLPWLTPVDDQAGPPPALAVRPEVLEVAYPADEDTADGPHELYQLLVAYRPAPHPDLQAAEIGRWEEPELGAVVAYDAPQDPEASAAVLRALLAEARLQGPDAELGFHLTAVRGLTPDLPASVFRGQQSNTSVMFGDVAMLKVFRRLELGRNLDIEVHDGLSRTGTADVAKLFGWADASWDGTDPATGAPARLQADLAMVVEKLAEATDGYDLALAALTAGRSFAEPATSLGRALAETHAALQTAFPTGTQQGADVAAVMRRRLAAASAVAPALTPYAEALGTVFDALAGRELDTQRVHGDFHLGQTLHTPGGWKIIDFEGEPAKTLVERRVPDSRWRDIGGMLRSFDYAAASVPGEHSRAWAQECRDAFLTGYAGGTLTETDAATLRAYEADKAVYEVVYEVRNRPDWVSIPLTAVADLARPHDQAQDAGTRPGASNQEEG